MEPDIQQINLVDTSNQREFTKITYPENTSFTDIVTDISFRIDTALGGQPAPIPTVKITFLVEKI